MKQLQYLLIVIILGVLIGFITSLYFNLPIVIKSYSTGECVDVLSGNKDYNCNNLPKRYVNEWAK